MIYIYKSHINPSMEYCYRIWAGVDQSSLKGFQKRLRGFMNDELFSTLLSLSHRRNDFSLLLLYFYYYGTCSNDIQSLVSPVQTSKTRTRHVSYTASNHSHPLRIPLVRRNLHWSSLFIRTLRKYFSDQCNLDVFKSKVNRYRSYIFT